MNDEVREFLIEIVDKLGSLDSKKEFFLTNLATQARELLIKEKRRSRYTSTSVDPFEAVSTPEQLELTYVRHENEL